MKVKVTRIIYIIYAFYRFHYKSWKQWCKRNQDVRLLVKCKIPGECREKSTQDKDNKNNNDNDQVPKEGRLSRVFTWFNFSLSHNTEPIYNFHQQTTFVWHITHGLQKYPIYFFSLLYFILNQLELWRCDRDFSCFIFCVYVSRINKNIVKYYVNM